ncbi:hypothetical protein [Clostridium sp. BL8]|nr:hypothetical protein [Clostridium sp. BL8]
MNSRRYMNNCMINIYLIPDVGHMTMMDQSNLFINTLLEINGKES